ncbi:MAG: Zn-dependent hydrolase, partial [Flavobacteriaceae bacterium]|nr:Zn-dependent hydrolase [Flavobacteriaceae bacterium]
MKKILILLLAITFVYSCKTEEKETEKPVEQEQTPMQKNLSKYVTVKLSSDVSKLSENERKMLPLLIEAADKMNDLFWYESYGDKTELLNSIKDQDIKKFIKINYGPWDRLAGNTSFVEGIED